jgi:hypothetical protein
LDKWKWMLFANTCYAVSDLTFKAIPFDSFDISDTIKSNITLPISTLLAVGLLFLVFSDIIYVYSLITRKDV